MSLLKRASSTDLHVIRIQPKRYTWGEITKIHDVGDYTVVEYTHNGETLFAPYVEGRDLGNSASTLEEALLLAIAGKHLTQSAIAGRAEAAAVLLGVGRTLKISVPS